MNNSDPTGAAIWATSHAIDECGSGLSTTTIDTLNELNEYIRAWNKIIEENNKKNKNKQELIPEITSPYVLFAVKDEFQAERDPRDGSVVKWAAGELLSFFSGFASPPIAAMITTVSSLYELDMLLNKLPRLYENYSYICYSVDLKTNVAQYNVYGETIVSECHVMYYYIWAKGIHNEPEVFVGAPSIIYRKEYPQR